MTVPYFELRIALLGVRPSIWRRIRIEAEASFWDLHVAIQNSMGWMDMHLHEFRMVDRHTRTERSFGIPDLDDERVEPGWSVSIGDFLDPQSYPIALYEYDFGDGWLHEVVLEALGNADEHSLPVCVDGEGACPPEDFGGPHLYQEFLDGLADPEHPAHAESLETARTGLGVESFDPVPFDPEEVAFEDPIAYWRQVFGDDPEFEDPFEIPDRGLQRQDPLPEGATMVDLLDYLKRDPMVKAAADVLGGEAEDIVRYHTLGRIFTSARERRGLTIKEVATRLRVPQYRIKAVEGSGIDRLTAEVLQRCAELFELESAVRDWISENEESARRLGLVRREGESEG